MASSFSASSLILEIWSSSVGAFLMSFIWRRRSWCLHSASLRCMSSCASCSFSVTSDNLWFIMF